MEIHFDGEAGEAFQRVLGQIGEGYIVSIIDGDGKHFDAEFLGPDTDAEFYDTVKLRNVSADCEYEPVGEPFATRIQRITVY